MKHRFKLLLIGIALTILTVSGWIDARSYLFPQTVHLYFDIATTPSLLQMIDMLEQDKQDPKFFAWRRFPNRAKFFDLKSINATEITLPTNTPGIGNSETEKLWLHDRDAIAEAIVNIYAQYPKAKYIVHLNRRQLIVAGENIFPTIPFNQIKRLHLYEDGHGEMAAQNPQELMQFITTADMTDFEQYMLGRQPMEARPLMEGFLFQKILPVTYHLGLYETLKSNPDAKQLLEYLSKAKIEPVSFWELKEKLSAKSKNQLRGLLGINLRKLNNLKQPKTVLYTLGVPLNDALKTDQVNVFQALKDGKISPDIDSSWQIFYKEHPWLIETDISNKINELHPDVKPLPKQIPLEILIILDALPEKIIGYSSSLFYSLPPERILGYIQRDEDPYLNTLLKNKTVSPEQVFDLKDFKNDR